MKKKSSVLIAFAVGVTLAVSPAFVAQAASGTIANGSFEADVAGSTAITGWTSINSGIDLGTTVIAGCTSADTSNYANLRDHVVKSETWELADSVDNRDDTDYVHDAEDNQVFILGERLAFDFEFNLFFLAIIVEDVEAYLAQAEWSVEQTAAFAAAVDAAGGGAVATARADDPANADLEEVSFSTRVITDGFEGPFDNDGDQEDSSSFGRDGNVLELYSDLSGDIDGYVAHGPAIYSEPFTVGTGRQISLDWKAVDESDDFHVFGYLLNVDNCAQTEVIDATGLNQDWTTAQVVIPAAGTYRFVFVSGSYDYSWGGAAGAFMYIDNIVQAPVFSTPGIDLSLAANVGEYLPGSEVQVSGAGLEPLTNYELVLRSTPITVTSGMIDEEGAFLKLVPLPVGIEPGPHTITLSGQGVDGPITLVAYITVGADGTLLYYSFSGPEAALAATGGNDNTMTVFFALLFTVVGAVALELSRRRSVTRTTNAS